jgi:hypothetical protein
MLHDAGNLEGHCMTASRQLYYNLLKKDALLIIDGVAYTLDGPFPSREAAEAAAKSLIDALEQDCDFVGCAPC